LRSGIRTNLHFILNSETISLATAFLKGYFDTRIGEINAVVFLTYKSAGRANKIDCLIADSSLDEFLFWVSNARTKVRFGFDACFVPQILRKTTLEPLWVDSCECSFFSVYIDEKLNVKPCSFSTDPRFTFNLHDFDFQFIWEKTFENYRTILFEKPCQLDCEKKIFCRGNCLFFPELTLCKDEDRLRDNLETHWLHMKGE
jgi:radical SAM protein with 4Fe4S-binding SPASM domain